MGCCSSKSWDPYEKNRLKHEPVTPPPKADFYAHQHTWDPDELSEQFNPSADFVPDSIHTNAEPNTGAIAIYEKDVLKSTITGGFRVIQELGKGGFGVVSLCERTGPSVHNGRRIPKVFALKELIAPKVFPLGQNKDIRDFLPLNEAAIQRILRHLAIVETYWADVRCLDPDTNKPLDIGADSLATWTSLEQVENINKTVTMQQQIPVKTVKLQMRIAMEHCDLGAIKDYLVNDPAAQRTLTLAESLRRRRKLTVAVESTLCALLASLDIAEALKFMHRSKTLHGDIKPQNILLVSTDDEKGFRAKISDFGLSQHMTKEQEFVLVSKGSEAYLPAEVFKDLKLTEKSDTYSLGLVMWEIFYGIFWHAIHAKEKRRRGARHAVEMADYKPSCNESCPEGFSAVVHRCLHDDPKRRPTAAEIVTELNGAIASLPRPPPAAPSSGAQHAPRGSGGPGEWQDAAEEAPRPGGGARDGRRGDARGPPASAARRSTNGHAPAQPAGW